MRKLLTIVIALCIAVCAIGLWGAIWGMRHNNLWMVAASCPTAGLAAFVAIGIWADYLKLKKEAA